MPASWLTHTEKPHPQIPEGSAFLIAFIITFVFLHFLKARLQQVQLSFASVAKVCQILRQMFIAKIVMKMYSYQLVEVFVQMLPSMMTGQGW